VRKINNTPSLLSRQKKPELTRRTKEAGVNYYDHLKKKHPRDILIHFFKNGLGDQIGICWKQHVRIKLIDPDDKILFRKEFGNPA